MKNGVLFLLNSESYLDGFTGYDEKTINQFNILENQEVKLITKDNIIAFEASKPFLESIASPQSILETTITTILETGSKTGRVEKIRDVGEFLGSIYMRRKKNIYNDYSWLELGYTLDGSGIDPGLIVGMKINFECSYCSGFILVREFTWDLKNGKTLIKGLGQLTYANN
jgi:hypothetical protein